MVMSAVIRRAAKSAARSITGACKIHQSVPSAVHFRQASNGVNGILHRLHNIRSTSCLCRFEQRFDFSSVSRKKGSDLELIEIIQSEIMYAEERYDEDWVKEIPEDFPFEIQDEEGKNIILLKRNYHGEQIEVRVSMPSLITGEEAEEDRGAQIYVVPDLEEKDDSYIPLTDSYIPLTVIINKGQGPSLEFHCTAYAEEVVINALTVRESAKVEMLPYDGSEIRDSDGDVQDAFNEYLEQRGFSEMNCKFLYEYMNSKDCREYLMWLKKVKKFVEN